MGGSGEAHQVIGADSVEHLPPEESHVGSVEGDRETVTRPSPSQTARAIGGNTGPLEFVSDSWSVQ